MGGGGSSPHPPASVRNTIRKKTKGSSTALLSVSHRTGPRASAPAPGSLPMKREGRRTNQSVCPPAITPFPPVIPGTSPPAGTNPAGHPCSSVRPAVIPAAKQSPATGAAGQPLGSQQKPAPQVVPYPAASPAILNPGEELTRWRSCTTRKSAFCLKGKNPAPPRRDDHAPGLQCNRSGRSRLPLAAAFCLKVKTPAPPAGANRRRFVHCKAFCRAWLDL